jgi:hypothetical protein
MLDFWPCGKGDWDLIPRAKYLFWPSFNFKLACFANGKATQILNTVISRVEDLDQGFVPVHSFDE